MKFRCKYNGVIIDFDDKETEAMMQHDGYEPVKDEPVEPVEAKPVVKKTKKKSKKKSKKKVANDPAPANKFGIKTA